MTRKLSTWMTCGIGILVSAVALSGRTLVPPAGGNPAPRHFGGLINDYTPSAAVVAGGPYEMRGKWSLDLDERRGTADFSAELNMETSDYGILQGTVDKDNPATRGAHTHHIRLTDAAVSYDWAATCPKFSTPMTDGFVVTGQAVVTGNGSAPSFGNPSTLTVCVLGGTIVQYSNVTMTFSLPAAKHFGLQAIHGVVVKCSGHKESRNCTVEP
jgi:hypothetical protein